MNLGLLLVITTTTILVLGEDLLDGKLQIVDRKETGNCNLTIQKGASSFFII